MHFFTWMYRLNFYHTKYVFSKFHETIRKNIIKCRDSLNLPKDLALNKDMPAESKNYTRFHNDFYCMKLIGMYFRIGGFLGIPTFVVILINNLITFSTQSVARTI